MPRNIKLLSNRQLRRKINNSVQNIFLSSCTQENNESNSTNMGNLSLLMPYAVDNNKNVFDIESVNDTNESSPALILTEFNTIDDEYTLYTDDSDSSTENNENCNDLVITHTFAINPVDFTHNLRRLAIDNNLTHAALNNILELINPAYPFLPRTARNLLRTPRKLEIISFDNGQMFYYGIQKSLMRKLQNSGLNCKNSINLIINIDGLPIFKSSRTDLWPILGRSDDIVDSHPFIIACFCGEGKPINLEKYLQLFIEEIIFLRENGFKYNDKTYYIEIECFAADAPARAMLKMIKGHTSIYGCERCTIKRVKNQTFFPVKMSNSVILRTKDDYINPKTNDNHVKGKSPLLTLNIDLVKQFVLDPMHIIYLGIMKRLLVKYWVEGGRHCKLSRQNLSSIDYNIQKIRPFVTSDFCRKPRALVNLKKFKATEFRFIVLYSGVIIFYNILNNAKYKHFLLLHVAITILSSVPLIKAYMHLAEEAIRKFVFKAAEIYGRDFVVYNVHSLLHLCADVQVYGPLERYSCFPFENYLQSLKRRIRSKKLPLSQVYNRIIEEENIGPKIESVTPVYLPKEVHFPNPNITDYFTCKKLIFKNMKISVKLPDNTVAVGNQIYVIKEIFFIDGKYKFIGTTFKYVNDLYRYPIHSSKLGIYYVKSININTSTTFFVNDISHKCLRLPFKEGFGVFPIIHQVS